MPHARTLVRAGWALAIAVAIALAAGRASVLGAVAAPLLPEVVTDVTATAGEQTAVFGGGCFWGVQAVFQRVKGVKSATSGYAGGTGPATYDAVSAGATGHAEVVRVVFDPAVVSYGTLLKVFFQVVHDPTQLNYQGPDRGTQYRSAIFTTSDEQRTVAQQYIAQLGRAKAYPAPIVTQVQPLAKFHTAERYHQGYFDTHPNQPYIVIHDKPKVEALKGTMPEVWNAKPSGW